MTMCDYEWLNRERNENEEDEAKTINLLGEKRERESIFFFLFESRQLF